MRYDKRPSDAFYSESNDPRFEKARAQDDDELINLRDRLANADIAEYPHPDTEEGMVGPQDDRYTHTDLYVGPPRSTYQETMRPENKDVHELQHFSLKLGKNMTELWVTYSLSHSL